MMNFENPNEIKKGSVIDKRFPYASEESATTLSDVFSDIYKDKIDIYYELIKKYIKEFIRDQPIGMMCTYDRLKGFDKAKSENLDDYYSNCILRGLMFVLSDPYGNCNVEAARQILNNTIDPFVTFPNDKFIYSEFEGDFTIDFPHYRYLSVYDKRRFQLSSDVKICVVSVDLATGASKIIGPEFSYYPSTGVIASSVSIRGEGLDPSDIIDLVTAFTSIDKVTIKEH